MAFTSGETGAANRAANASDLNVRAGRHRTDLVPLLRDIGTIGRAVAREAGEAETALDLVKSQYPNAADIAAANAQIPAYNLFPDSGRFTVLPAPDVYVGAFDPPGFFGPYNGATPWASVGKFIHNNTDNGGSGGSMTEPVTSLLAHGGASNDRYGIEFHVAEMTAGTGTLGSSVTEGGASYNILTFNDGILLPQAFSLSFYFRCVSGGVHLNAFHEIDGVAAGPGVLATGSWHRLRLTHTELDGFSNQYPFLRATPGAVAQMALPALLPGHFSRPDIGGISRILAAGALA